MKDTQLVKFRISNTPCSRYKASGRGEGPASTPSLPRGPAAASSPRPLAAAPRAGRAALEAAGAACRTLPRDRCAPARRGTRRAAPCSVTARLPAALPRLKEWPGPRQRHGAGRGEGAACQCAAGAGSRRVMSLGRLRPSRAGSRRAAGPAQAQSGARGSPAGGVAECRRRAIHAHDGLDARRRRQGSQLLMRAREFARCGGTARLPAAS